VKVGELKLQSLEEKSKKDKIKDEEVISQLQQKIHSQTVGEHSLETNEGTVTDATSY
jgi:hypothetical protein